MQFAPVVFFIEVPGIVQIGIHAEHLSVSHADVALIRHPAVESEPHPYR